jgi:hypothetical protein
VKNHLQMTCDARDRTFSDASLALFRANSKQSGFSRPFALAAGRVLYQSPLFMASALSGDQNRTSLAGTAIRTKFGTVDVVPVISVCDDHENAPVRGSRPE